MTHDPTDQIHQTTYRASSSAPGFWLYKKNGVYTVPRLVSWRTAKVSAGRSKHLPSGSTNDTNNGNIINSSARTRTGRSNGSIVISREHALEGTQVGLLRQVMQLYDQTLTTTRRWTWMARTLSPQTAFTNLQASSAEDNEEYQITHLPFRSWYPNCVYRRTAQRGSPQSASTTFSWARKACLSQIPQQQDTLLVFGVYDYQTRVTFAQTVRHPG